MSGATKAGELEVDSSDVVKLVMQFCVENGLTKTFNALQEEAKVSLNVVPSLEGFQSDVKNGRWDAVLRALNQTTLPSAKLLDLYEQIAIEMVELREVDVARALMKESPPLRHMADKEPERFARLQQLCTKTFFDVRDAYPDGSTAKKRRTVIATNLSQDLTVVQPSRLLTLISQALRWEQQEGLLPTGSKFDLFRGVAKQKTDLYETFPTTLLRSIKFGKKACPEAAAFSPDGSFFFTGCIDGFIECWDVDSGKLRKDLPYQKEEDSPFLMHEVAVLCLAFSLDSTMMASGSQDGMVMVWNVQSGQCLKKFDRAHQKGVTSVAFAKDGSQILTGSFDATARIHGLRSGKIGIKEYRGHKSYVNDVCFSSDGLRILTASSDGTCRIWDTKSMETLFAISSSQVSVADPPQCYRIVPIPNTTCFGLCARTPYITIIDISGKVVKTLRSGKRSGGEFISCTVSPKGEWIYCIGEDSLLYCFNTERGKLEHTLKASEKELINVTHHPKRNLLTTWGQDYSVKFWVPEDG
ncbi:Suppressor of mec-8 and unc-52 protein-like protein 1 [Diplonema papillatum]|nr:Suppressor of mec-8 and unc-52 protein-like protein 1 [Diplonema papillatum]WGM50017.1 SMU1 [Diplonema papillatum]